MLSIALLCVLMLATVQAQLCPAVDITVLPSGNSLLIGLNSDKHMIYGAFGLEFSLENCGATATGFIPSADPGGACMNNGDLTNFDLSCTTPSIYQPSLTTFGEIIFDVDVNAGCTITVKSDTTDFIFKADMATRLNVHVLHASLGSECWTSTTASSPGDCTGLCGDPHFVGFHGQRYDVSGEDGEVYNLITDRNLQFNSRFVACPEDHAEAGPECVVNGEFGIKTASGDRWLVTRDGLVEKNGGVIEQSATSAVIETEDYMFTVQCSLGQELNLVGIQSKRSDEEMAPHGLLGHTHVEREYPEHDDSFRFLEGGLEDYHVKSGDLFGDDFTFNMFNTA